MKTAIDYLVEKLAENGIIHSFDISKAKEMEKQQIIYFGNKMQLVKDIDFDGNIEFAFNPENYFNETFKTDKG